MPAESSTNTSVGNNLPIPRHEEFLQALKKKYAGRQHCIPTKASAVPAPITTKASRFLQSRDFSLKHKIKKVLQDDFVNSSLLGQRLPPTSRYGSTGINEKPPFLHRRYHSNTPSAAYPHPILPLSPCQAPSEQVTSSPIRKLYDSTTASATALRLAKSRSARIEERHEERREKSKSHRELTAKTITSIDSILTSIRENLSRKGAG